MTDGPRKPAWGSPCNGCGVCCVAESCPIALIVVPDAEESEPCPALEWEGGRSWCGLIRNPEKHIDDVGAMTWTILYGTKRGDLSAWMLAAIGDGECDSGGDLDSDLGLTAQEFLDGA